MFDGRVDSRLGAKGCAVGWRRRGLDHCRHGHDDNRVDRN
jgi:hypothetical protein